MTTNKYYSILKKITLIIFLVGYCSYGLTQDLSEPEKLLREAISQAMAEINLDKSIIQDKTKLLSLVENQVLPLFNMRRITARTVGREGWPAATTNQRELLVKYFTDLLVYTYSNALISKKDVDPNIVIDWGRAIVDEKRAEIQSSILVSDAKVRFDYVLRYSNKTGWKIDDLVLENLSIFNQYKEQFAAVMKNQGGVDGLINKLKEDVDKLKASE